MPPVSRGETVYHLSHLRLDIRVRHAERTKDSLGDEPTERSTRDALHEEGEQKVAGIVIQEFSAGLVVQRLLPMNQPEHVGLRLDIRDAPSRHVEEIPVVAETGGVVQQLAYRDGLSKLRNLRNVASDIVCEPKFAFRLEEENGECRELLRRRGDRQSGGVREGDVVRDIRHPEGPAVEDGARPEHTDGAAWSIVPAKRREDRGDAVRDRVLAAKRLGRCDGGRQVGERQPSVLQQAASALDAQTADIVPNRASEPRAERAGNIDGMQSDSGSEVAQ